MQAIVFDFFGTLTDPAAEAHRSDAFAATAAALDVSASQFYTVMSSSFSERITGVHGNTRQTLLAMARRCGVEPAEDQLDRAVVVQRQGAARVQQPRAGVFEVLDLLRERGFRLGLLSDCSSELYERWPQSSFAARFDATVFSWQEGYRKPDARLYATAAARLGVAAGDCWYVGDGGSREHQGALTAGMRPVLITNANLPDVAHYRDDPDTLLPEYSVDELAELPDLFESRGTTTGAPSPGAARTSDSMS
ncbi:MAG TPA: haloacid dehalogenase [Micromonosporaceae bacterium]|nr:haloacid dehalogenase [Micromonosporaceae bacterium]HCU51467.1 haloacid dehalogenase [Micromonosporaceae bacterium]